MMKAHILPKDNKGFTLIELMIAMSVLAVLLLIATMTLLNLGRMYTKGTTQASVQDTTRNVMSDISSALQLGGSDYLPGDGAFCIGTTRYSYVIGREITADPANSFHKQPTKHALWRDTMTSSSNCPGLNMQQDVPSDDLTKPNTGRELIPENMRLTELKVTPASSGLYQVNLGIAYGDDDLLCVRGLSSDCDSQWIADHAGPHATNLQSNTDKIGCIATIGNQFCSVSNLSVSVVQRVTSE